MKHCLPAGLLLLALNGCRVVGMCMDNKCDDENKAVTPAEGDTETGGDCRGSRVIGKWAFTEDANETNYITFAENCVVTYNYCSLRGTFARNASNNGEASITFKPFTGTTHNGCPTFATNKALRCTYSAEKVDSKINPAQETSVLRYSCDNVGATTATNVVDGFYLLSK